MVCIHIDLFDVVVAEVGISGVEEEIAFRHSRLHQIHTDTEGANEIRERLRIGNGIERTPGRNVHEKNRRLFPERSPDHAVNGDEIVSGMNRPMDTGSDTYQFNV